MVLGIPLFLYMLYFIFGLGCFLALFFALFTVYAICSETKRAIKERLVWK